MSAALAARGLSRRLLHDLASPVAALGAAVDLLEPGPREEDARRLVAARDSLAARVALFRLLLGPPGEALEAALVEPLVAAWLGEARTLAPLSAGSRPMLRAGLVLLWAAERRLARGRLMLDPGPTLRLEGEGRLAEVGPEAAAAWAGAIDGAPDDDPAHAPLHLLVADGWRLNWSERPGRFVAEARRA